MPTDTLINIVSDINRKLGVYETFATTTNITTDTSVVSTTLRNLGYDADDMLNGKWVMIAGTANDEVSRYISDYTASSGTISVRGTALAAESGSMTCYVFADRWGAFVEAVREARIYAFPYLFSRVIKEVVPTGYDQYKLRLPGSTFIGPPDHVYVSSILDVGTGSGGYKQNILRARDPGFETVGESGSSWDATNFTHVYLVNDTDLTPADNYVVLTGTKSAALRTNGGSSDATLVNDISSVDSPAGDDWSVVARGQELNVTCWVYCKTASRVRLRINDGATVTNGDFHTGTGWEKITVGATIGAAVTTLQIILVDDVNDAALTFYADNIVATLGPQEPAEDVYPELRGWRFIPPYTSDSDGYLLFDEKLPKESVLRIEGRTYLTDMTADSGTTEVDEDEEKLLVEFALQVYAKSRLNRSLLNGQTRDFYEKIIMDSEEETARLIGRRASSVGKIQHSPVHLPQTFRSLPV
jgi:hypothetical protein